MNKDFKLPTETFQFTLLSDCLCGGANQHAHAEMRPPSLRGQLRIWHKILHDETSTKNIWGTAAGDKGQASKIAIAITPAWQQKNSRDASILPHKGNRGGSRPAIPAGTNYTLTLTRTPQCKDDKEWQNALATTRTTLILGSLGLRSARAAGSLWLTNPDPINTQDQLINFITPLKQKGWAFALAPDSIGTDWKKLRTAASDTKIDPPNMGNHAECETSPVRYKIIQIDGKLRLLILGPKQNVEGAKQSQQGKPITPNQWQTL